VDWDELNVIAAFTTILMEPTVSIFMVEQYSSSLKGWYNSSTLHGVYNTPDDSILFSHCCKNLRSHINRTHNMKRERERESTRERGLE